jgi:hypothetical protein
MDMNIDIIKNVITIYMTANEETKQEIKNVLGYLDSLDKTKS